MAWGNSYNSALSPLGNQVFTVSQFLDMINELVAPLTVTIQGEITSFDIRGTNIFATIADTKEQAKLSLYIYKPTLDRLDVELEEGMEVVIKGTPGIYKASGNFNLRVSHVSPVGEGALKKAFERMVAKLRDEGLFAESLKRPIPAFPVTIGVISSQNGDALHDFRKHLLPFNLKIHFVDARVEGVNSIESVVQALRTLNESNIPLDVIVLTRGGGSLESLQAFNSEPVARAIRASRVPVISAIGHEQDVTIADYVADLRASTPTDAAKRLSYNWSKASEQVIMLNSSIFSNFKKSVSSFQNRLTYMYDRMLSAYQQELSLHKSVVKQSQTEALSYLHHLQYKVENLSNRFDQNTKAYETELQNAERDIVQTERTLAVTVESIIRQTSRMLQNFEDSINSNDPHNRLKQGYSIVTNGKGKVIKSREETEREETLDITLFNGKIKTKVIEK
jgi:exodeoxyribonuclease VII large subunit